MAARARRTRQHQKRVPISLKELGGGSTYTRSGEFVVRSSPCPLDTEPPRTETWTGLPARSLERNRRRRAFVPEWETERMRASSLQSRTDDDTKNG
jgi:hypothetical protein